MIKSWIIVAYEPFQKKLLGIYLKLIVKMFGFLKRINVLL